VAGIEPAQVLDAVKCPRCGGEAPGGHMFCPTCGAQLPTLSGAPTPEEVRRITAGRAEYRPDSQPVEGGTEKSPLVRSGATPSPDLERGWGRLVSVKRDGTDGPVYQLTGGFADVGTGPVKIRLADDPHVASRHVRFERNGSAVQVVPLDEVNGVMWRLTEPTEILDGHIVLIGRELCQIDIVDQDEHAPPLTQHGVAMFASPLRKPWARLSQILTSGAIGDVRHFYGDEVIVGREEGDIIFADDEFMSRRHAAFRLEKGRCILEDLDSSNGTFVRLDGATLISDGDYLRVGDHMFRFEATQ
jgi:hypothetical protein